MQQDQAMEESPAPREAQERSHAGGAPSARGLLHTPPEEHAAGSAQEWRYRSLPRRAQLAQHPRGPADCGRQESPTSVVA
eukprot:CAMPEP_0170630000 /NCGR_PEP_ID=MMETSP0224-20130122/33698_1 /TAXON_ID=285029 /ORGANISM="Togula jolla, Strain CCCM 725" /LENGTH=79 /DNA_ID=CAMNT_0010957891 /DNA_START=294 /DNA_END=533 /DNA_ORIENTATION=-